MAQRQSPPVESHEDGTHIPNLDIRLPDLIADSTDAIPESYEYPVGTYPIPDFTDQDEEELTK